MCSQGKKLKGRISLLQPSWEWRLSEQVKYLDDEIHQITVKMLIINHISPRKFLEWHTINEHYCCILPYFDTKIQLDVALLPLNCFIRS